ncbi:DapH/DapD/GlmU-related protein [Priestia megaterium]|uniref:DapH/DapD/GlmU-related protein n=1 Tax=Priestia megaterium TaxID=1404 RepID=UPI001C3F298A|nr:DapH/DapD/GlmU-related protein [Priestia megaterium]
MLIKNQYSTIELIKNTCSFIYTRIFFRKARLIRLPFYLRGRCYLSYGEGFTTGYNCRIEMFDFNKKNDKKIIIGQNTKIGDYVHIAAGEKVIIGDNCLFASKIYISDISHGVYDGSQQQDSNPMLPPDKRELTTNPVIIGNNVWLGENVSVLPGVKIGNGCVIGANSVVTKSIKDNTIAVGVPAKAIKEYDIEKQKWIRLK